MIFFWTLWIFHDKSILLNRIGKAMWAANIAGHFARYHPRRCYLGIPEQFLDSEVGTVSEHTFFPHFAHQPIVSNGKLLELSLQCLLASVRDFFEGMMWQNAGRSGIDQWSLGATSVFFFFLFLPNFARNLQQFHLFHLIFFCNIGNPEIDRTVARLGICGKDHHHLHHPGHTFLSSLGLFLEYVQNLNAWSHSTIRQDLF